MLNERWIKNTTYKFWRVKGSLSWIFFQFTSRTYFPGVFIIQIKLQWNRFVKKIRIFNRNVNGASGCGYLFFCIKKEKVFHEPFGRGQKQKCYINRATDDYKNIKIPVVTAARGLIGMQESTSSGRAHKRMLTKGIRIHRGIYNDIHKRHLCGARRFDFCTKMHLWGNSWWVC